MAGRHPGNPAKMPADHVSHAAIREWERQCEAGMICWFCTDPAVATLVEPSLEVVHRDGRWVQAMVHRPVCGTVSCRYGFGP